MSELETGAVEPPETERCSLRFGGLDIVYDETLLVPRPWTIAQSTWARELLGAAPHGDVLELCSGAGHIGLAAVHGTTRRLVQVDREPRACEIARENATAAGVAVDVRCGPMTKVLRDDEQFALVIADPPWVPSAGVQVFPDDPVWAIDGGEDGLDLARECVRLAAAHLKPEGSVVLQVGPRGPIADLDDVALDCGLRVVEVRELTGGRLLLLRPR